MELIKRREIKIGGTYGMNYVREASDLLTGDVESSMYMYNDRPIVRREYLKCMSCSFHHKPKVCEKFACTSGERKDGKSIVFRKI